MMIKVSMAVEAANRGVKDGSLPKAMTAFLEQNKPEAAYFGIEHGRRTSYFFVDMKENSALPSLVEPLFNATHGEIEVTPVMNANELKAGLEKLPRS